MLMISNCGGDRETLFNMWRFVLLVSIWIFLILRDCVKYFLKYLCLVTASLNDATVYAKGVRAA
jgi:hypothetical protein